MMTLRFTCGKRNIFSTIKKSQNIVNMVVETFPKANLFYQLKTNDQNMSIAVDISLLFDVHSSVEKTALTR